MRFIPAVSRVRIPLSLRQKRENFQFSLFLSYLDGGFGSTLRSSVEGARGPVDLGFAPTEDHFRWSETESPSRVPFPFLLLPLFPFFPFPCPTFSTFSTFSTFPLFPFSPFPLSPFPPFPLSLPSLILVFGCLRSESGDFCD